MVKVNPYLNFKGNTEEAFKFYKSVFGGEFLAVVRFKDTPEKDKVPKEEQDKIMYIALPIGKDCVLMATDALESMGQKLDVGNNFYISVDVESKKEADITFNKLSHGGKIEMPIQDAFWGDYCGMFRDKFGIQWMINFNKKKN